MLPENLAQTISSLSEEKLSLVQKLATRMDKDNPSSEAWFKLLLETYRLGKLDNTLIHVNRFEQPSCLTIPEFDQEWLTSEEFRGLHEYGPEQYGVGKITFSKHHSFEKFHKSGYSYFHDLKIAGMIGACLSLHDLVAIKKLGSDFFLRHFNNRDLYAWRSATKNLVPCLLYRSIGFSGDKLYGRIEWNPLGYQYVSGENEFPHFLGE